ncbi:agouti-signaling protein 2b [Lampris incognitus]|uniref:agouti-signaling protein 2b n=1 Tax=Lampris incognitus TaxID=2546036 RepID=UPI0024B4CDE8|nr:agouti-signaling protein 2b [Lampris incognitus]
MRKIMGKYLLCICLLAIPLSSAEDMMKRARETQRDADLVWSQRQLFARQRAPEHHASHGPKSKQETRGPVRSCSGLLENCSPKEPCCDPCASCHCRLFNTICRCWRMGSHCSRKM